MPRTMLRILHLFGGTTILFGGSPSSYRSGVSGGSIHFDESQMKLNEEQGNTVTPYSLYEAQLRKRLGQFQLG